MDPCAALCGFLATKRIPSGKRQIMSNKIPRLIITFFIARLLIAIRNIFRNDSFYPTLFQNLIKHFSRILDFHSRLRTEKSAERGAFFCREGGARCGLCKVANPLVRLWNAMHPLYAAGLSCFILKSSIVFSISASGFTFSKLSYKNPSNRTSSIAPFFCWKSKSSRPK